nr:MAG TPA: hypothetical protein [Caudoviricetes sp.]DAN45849.1 MAG TPA: hypothetical protein [Caudoviricetes sp.]
MTRIMPMRHYESYHDSPPIASHLGGFLYVE